MWTEVIFVVERDRVEAWSEALLEAGALAVQAEDADRGSPDEQAIFGEPGEAAPAPGWVHTRLAAMIDARSDPGRLLAGAAARCGEPQPDSYCLRAVPEQDWVHATQAQFEPIPIGKRLLVTPSWHLQADRNTRTAAGEPAEKRTTIVLDPGLAFGTGSHPTTRMCLEWLDAHLVRGMSVIDYGCGSGILGIAAAALGASRVVAIDIDPQALESARANARANGVSIDVRAPAGKPPERAKVVVANILANPLRILAPLLSSMLAPGGQLVLAGLLDRQANEIARCYPEVALRAWRSIDGWTCLAGAARR